MCLVPTLFNMYFDAVIYMTPSNTGGYGVVMYHPHRKPVGNCRTLISGMEYANGLTLVAASREDLRAML